MLPGLIPVARQPGWLIEAIRYCGMQRGLQFCVDARDAVSWPGAGTQIIDRSGNGFDFDFTNQVSFSGLVGTFSGAFDFNNSGFFTYETTNPAWVDSMHMSGAKFSGIFLFYLVGSVIQNIGIFSDRANVNNNIGISFHYTTAGKVNIQVSNNPSNVFSFSGADSLDFLANNIIGWCIDEAAGASSSYLMVNSKFEWFNAAYTSPQSSAATFALTLCSRNSNNRWPSSSYFFGSAMWNRIVAPVEMQGLRQRCMSEMRLL